MFDRVVGVPTHLDVFLAAVTLLVFSGLAWEKDQARAVGLEALDIHGEGFGGEIGAAGVD